MTAKLKNLQIREGSLVDKGANQEADVVLFKRDKGGLVESIKQTFKKFLHMDDEAQGVSDILDQKEMHRELFEIDDALRMSVNSILEDDDVPNKRAAIAETLSQYLQELVDSGIVKIGRKVSGGRMAILKELMTAMGKAMESLGVMLEEVDGIEKKGSDSMSIDEKVLKGLPEDVQAHIAEIQKSADEKAEFATKNEELETKVSELEKSNEDEGKAEEELLKGASDELVKKYEAMEERVTKAEDIAKVEQEARITKEYENEASKLDLVGDQEVTAQILRSADAVSKEHGDSVRENLKANQARIKESDLLKEIGSDGSGGSDSWSKIEAMAKELVSKSDMTEAQAIVKVLETDAGAKLYAQHNEQEVN